MCPSKYRLVVAQLMVIADDIETALVLDLSEILLHDLHGPMWLNAKDQLSWLDFLEPLWARLQERGRHLVLVVPPEKRYLLEIDGWERRCQIKSTEAEAIAVGGELALTPLTPKDLLKLFEKAIERLRGTDYWGPGLARPRAERQARTPWTISRHFAQRRWHHQNIIQVLP